MRRLLIALLAAVNLAGSASCDHHGPTAPAGSRPIRVLFMGNSLTYTNDLPGMVAAIAQEAGVDIETQSSSFPNAALIDHWDDAERALVRNGHFDYVVLQQGPSTLPENRDSLRLWTGMWAPEIRSAGGQPGLFAVWPEIERMYAFPDVSESYRLAAQDVGGAFFPVGDTWLEVWSSQPDAELYGSDGYHPAIGGTYAAAIVILATITHRDATSFTGELPATFDVYGRLDPALAYTIRLAATSVLQRLGPQPTALRR